jgi:Flp pilus assembly protein TadD
MAALRVRRRHACLPEHPMPPALRRILPLLFAAFAATVAPVTVVAQDVRELTVEERGRYAAVLADAATLIRDRQFDAATTKLDALLVERPREAQARFLRAVVDAESGRTDDAVRRFRELVADFPELPEPWNNLAVIQAQKGDYDAARFSLENAVQAAPDWSIARENLGDVYARLAAANYDRAARADRSNKTAPAKRALVTEMLARPAPAKP